MPNPDNHRWTDWVPTLGGRSVRPILDRMDWALTQLLEGYEVTGAPMWRQKCCRTSESVGQRLDDTGVQQAT